jgi:hypothetical protein
MTRPSPAAHICTALVATLLVGASGCKKSDIALANGDDPIAALNAKAPTGKYVHEYWLDQATRRTPLWDRAYALCSAYWPHQDGTKPNCGHVYTANFYRSGATTPIRKKNMSVDSLFPKP